MLGRGMWQYIHEFLWQKQRVFHRLFCVRLDKLCTTCGLILNFTPAKFQLDPFSPSYITSCFPAARTLAQFYVIFGCRICAESLISAPNRLRPIWNLIQVISRPAANFMKILKWIWNNLVTTMGFKKKPQGLYVHENLLILNFRFCQ